MRFEMHMAKPQRGFLLILAVVIVAVAAVMAVVIVTLTTGSGIAGGTHVNATQSLEIAKSGMERAQNQLASGTACTALTNTNVALGNGTYTTSGTNFSVTAGVTVGAGGITAVATTIPVSTIATLARHGRVRINLEEIDYGDTSSLVAACGAATPCLLGARRARGGTIAAAQAAGSLVRQSQCLIRSTGTVNATSRTLERTVHPPVVMIVYSKLAADTNIYYRLWDPTIPGWGAEQTANAVSANIKFLVLRFARTRNEAVLASLDSVDTNNGNWVAQVWNGFTWNIPAGGNPVVNICACPNNDWEFRALDIAYETANDRAVIVHDSGGDAIPVYRIWDGTTLSGTTATGMSNGGGVNWPRWIDLAANPNSASNEIALITLQSTPTRATRTLRGMAWNGAAWSDMGQAGASWDNAPTDANSRHATSVAYEQNSGRAIFAWGYNASAVVRHRIWNGAALTASAAALPLGGGVAQWVRLSPRYNSNELMLAAQGTSGGATGRLESSWWNGAAWSGSTVHSTTTENVASRNFDVHWEGDLSNLSSAQIVYGVNGGVVNRKRWAGGAWGAATTSGTRTSLVQLEGIYVYNRLFAGLYENSASPTDDTTEMSFVSTTAAWSVPTSIWPGVTIGDPTHERVFIQGRKAIFIEEQEVFP